MATLGEILFPCLAEVVFLFVVPDWKPVPVTLYPVLSGFVFPRFVTDPSGFASDLSVPSSMHLFLPAAHLPLPEVPLLYLWSFRLSAPCCSAADSEEAVRLHIRQAGPQA